jgi:hypothetical protein
VRARCEQLDSPHALRVLDPFVNLLGNPVLLDFAGGPPSDADSAPGAMPREASVHHERLHHGTVYSNWTEGHLNLTAGRGGEATSRDSII